ncbi:MAG: hypothetical protein QM736_03545 [Vicinamibacterales bacterium]
MDGERVPRRGSNLLQLNAGNGIERFSPDQVAVQELAGRQVKLVDMLANGLKATRRVYVPERGYYARATSTASTTRRRSPCRCRLHTAAMGTSDTGCARRSLPRRQAIRCCRSAPPTRTATCRRTTTTMHDLDPLIDPLV